MSKGGLVRFRFQIGKNALSATSAIGAIDSASESTNVFFAPRASNARSFRCFGFCYVFDDLILFVVFDRLDIEPKAATTTPTSKFDPLLNSRKLSRRLAAAVAEGETRHRLIVF